jgi:4-amino-4-deoxychorismate lyase
MVLINGKPEDRIDIADRGLQYGDGVFETMAYRNSRVEFLEQHLQRLQLGCKTLAINFEQIDNLRFEIDTACEHLGHDNAVIKVIVTRGTGSRGYFSLNDTEPTRIVSTHPFPKYPDTHQTEGVYLRFCEQTLSLNRKLAGIKHLNRLEQVIARNEWDDSDIAEGIMSDSNENIIECTMSNIFIVESGGLHTPTLFEAGIAGVMRAQIIQLASRSGISVEERPISRQELAGAEEVFVCNSIIGIWPVHTISNKYYPVGFITKFLQKSLADMAK